jgi:hypothetical protein
MVKERASRLQFVTTTARDSAVEAIASSNEQIARSRLALDRLADALARSLTALDRDDAHAARDQAEISHEMESSRGEPGDAPAAGDPPEV